MNCYDEGILIDFVENELKPDARAEVEQHLAWCPACRNQVAALGRLYTVLEQDAMPEPDWTTVQRNITRAIRKPRFFRLPYFIPVPVAAAAALALIILFRNNANNVDIVIPYSASEFVYSSSESFQTRVLAEILAGKPENQLTEIGTQLDAAGDLSDLLDELTDTQTAALYKNLKAAFGSFNGT